MYWNPVVIIVMGWSLLGNGALPEARAAESRIPEVVAEGREVYQRCIACHSLDRNRTGPKHCGLIGRTAGAIDGFPYSRAMADSGIVWTRTTLNAFLTSPFELIPGTTMGFAGIPADQDRQALIAYLEFADRELCNEHFHRGNDGPP